LNNKILKDIFLHIGNGSSREKLEQILIQQGYTLAEIRKCLHELIKDQIVINDTVKDWMTVK